MLNRWVTYIYQYRAGKREDNIGFIKAQKICCRTGDSVRFRIGIKLYKTKPCKCTIYLADGELIYKIKEFCVSAHDQDTLLLRFEVPWWSPVGLDKAVTDYMGLYFLCEDGDCCGGFWKDVTVLPQTFVDAKDKQQEREETPKQDEDIRFEQQNAPEQDDGIRFEQQKQEEYTQVFGVHENQERYVPSKAIKQWKPRDLTHDYHSMLDTYPKLPLFSNKRLLHCVKIMPQDIGRLPIGNWKLGTNSFVTHGFYHYQYLMLGNVLFEQGERLVIGIPGVYTVKEKYVANMFGFARFVPAQECDYMTGRFGYWVSEVVTE